MTNEQIRRELGTELINAEREEDSRHAGTAVVIGAARKEALPKGTLYFATFEDFEAWCESEGGTLD